MSVRCSSMTASTKKCLDELCALKIAYRPVMEKIVLINYSRLVTNDALVHYRGISIFKLAFAAK